MTYFEDLTTYVYIKETESGDCTKELNIGWISPDHSFRVGHVSSVTVDRIRKLCEKPIRLTRGLHACEFCAPGKSPYLLEAEGQGSLIGNGEIRVVSKTGIAYVAPVIIHHYIVVHRYLPPREFLHAINSVI